MSSVAIWGSDSWRTRDILETTFRQNVSTLGPWSHSPLRSAASSSELEFSRCDKILEWYSTGKPRENFSLLEFGPCKMKNAKHWKENKARAFPRVPWRWAERRLVKWHLKQTVLRLAEGRQRRTTLKRMIIVGLRSTGRLQPCLPILDWGGREWQWLNKLISAFLWFNLNHWISLGRFLFKVVMTRLRLSWNLSTTAFNTAKWASLSWAGRSQPVVVAQKQLGIRLQSWNIQLIFRFQKITQI